MCRVCGGDGAGQTGTEGVAASGGVSGNTLADRTEATTDVHADDLRAIHRRAPGSPA